MGAIWGLFKVLLVTLGTAPERQGQGVGSALLRSMCDHIDEVGEPGFLEVIEGAERAALRSVRFQGDRRAALDLGQPAHLANVARTQGPRDLIPSMRLR